MYDDILGGGDKEVEVTRQGIIDALKDNLRQKEELIDDLLRKITELEKENERLERMYLI